LIQPSPAATLPMPASKPTGVLQLEVEPTSAQVYVDGFSVGTVDAVNARGGLTLTTGWHRAEFRMSGYETTAVDVTIDADRTVVARRTLQPTSP
jgi:PEGA domain